METLRNEALLGVWRASRLTRERPVREVSFETFDHEVEPYPRYRGMLMWAWERYFSWRHYEDHKALNRPGWDILNRFAEKLSPGDVVITFNYDATLRAGPFRAGKWSPKDGFGFDLELQESRHHKTGLHPSFLKDYETGESGSHQFTDLGRRAAQVLREAERAYIIGYSLPKADSAARTLLLTSCREGLVRVINPDGGTKLGLVQLLRGRDGFGGTSTFKEWVDAGCAFC